MCTINKYNQIQMPRIIRYTDIYIPVFYKIQNYIVALHLILLEHQSITHIDDAFLTFKTRSYIFIITKLNVTVQKTS